MKVYAEEKTDDFGLNRLVREVKKYAPPEIEFVDNHDDAELIVLYAHGFRKQTWYTVGRQMAKKRQTAIIQINIRSTPNPNTADWIRSWENSKLVWSYYDLPVMCAEDGNEADFNFYHAPLGVDADNFKETKAEREYLVAIHSRGWSRESLKDVWQAARPVDKPVLNFNNAEKGSEEGIVYAGNINTGDPKKDDQILSGYYSRCKYVSGLRRTEGFEMPVLEGLMCGTRPICFDLPCYRTWFEGLVEFIPENGSANIIPALTEIFKTDPRPVSEQEKQIVREKFNWQKIVGGFWERVLE